jgi:DNA polymerase III subunit delta
MRVPPLRAAIQSKQFAPAYYLFGDDDYLKEDGLRQLIDAAVDPGTRDFNLDRRRGAELDAASLASLLATPPMMADRRVVVIRDISELRKDARAALEQYLRAPASDILVALTSPADAKEDRALSELAIPVDCAALSGVQLPKWIVARAEKLGTSISPAAVELLQDAVGTDLSQLAVELDKLASYCSGKTIDEEAVAAIVGVRRDETLGHLLDAVAMRDTRLALSLLPKVLQQPKATAVYMVMALTTQMLALAIGQARGFTPSRQYNDYMSLLRSGGSNVAGRAWGEAVSCWIRANGKWNLADLDHALEVLLLTDQALKASRVSSEEQVLASAVLSICGGAAHRHAA